MATVLELVNVSGSQKLPFCSVNSTMKSTKEAATKKLPPKVPREFQQTKEAAAMSIYKIPKKTKSPKSENVPRKKLI